MTDKTIRLIDVDVAPAGFEEIDGIIAGYKAYQTIKAVLELGLFDYLDQTGPSSQEEISTALKINCIYTPSLLQTLLDMDMLVKHNNKYTNSELARKFLSSSSPNYQGDIIKMAAKSTKWDNLHDKLTRSSPHKKAYDSTGIGWDTLKSLSQRCMQGELQEVSQAIVDWESFQRAESVLDIGGGHGLYAISLCQVNPRLQGLVFDQPHVIGLTSQYIAKYHLEDRMKVQSGDINVDTPDGKHDIIIASHILYKFSNNLPSMLNKISKCLKPGGLLASNHWFEKGSSHVSKQSSLQELDKSLNSPGHHICPFEEYAGYLNEAGFSILRIVDIPSSFDGSTLHLAIKSK